MSKTKPEKVRWWENREYMHQALSYQVGDYVYYRPEVGGTFIQECGPGPFTILDISNPGQTGRMALLLGDVDGNYIPLNLQRNRPEQPTSWMFAHIFERNNFLALAHKAITCKPSKSEP